MKIEYDNIKKIREDADRVKFRLKLAERIILMQDEQISEQQEKIHYLHSVVSSMRLSMRAKRMLGRILPGKLFHLIEGFRREEVDNSVDEKRVNFDYRYREPLQNSDIQKDMLTFETLPLISILLPLENPEFKLLENTINSIEVQWYPRWELCISLSAANNKEVSHYLESKENENIKIKYTEEEPGKGALLKAALAISEGEYMAVLNQGDLLTTDALYEVVKEINEEHSEFIYSDEDNFDVEETYIEPIFKPDFSYDLLLSFNYIGNFFVVKSDIVEGRESFEIIINAIEKTNRISHIHKVLYHKKKQYDGLHTWDENMKVIQEHLNKNGIDATAKRGEIPFTFDIEYNLPRPLPLVSIIIPTKDAVGYLDECIRSILEISTYQSIEILILNNNSVEEKTFQWFDEYQKKYSFIKVLDANYDFNWAKLNNQGIRAAEGEVYIFLNNDIKVITPNWIERLVSRALQPKVGTVGALLLFEDDTIQHAGVVVGLKGWADHIYRGSSYAQIEDFAPFVSPFLSRNVLASTGACLVISKRTIEEIGDFDEEYIVAHSDVEISLRAYERGYRNIFDGGTRLYHYESKTRGRLDPECDLQRSKNIYQYYWEKGDPYFNRNLSVAEYHPTPV